MPGNVLLVLSALMVVATEALQQQHEINDFVEVCSSSSGSLSISPRANHIATVNEGRVPTVFVNFDREFNFECRLKREYPNHAPQIEFKPYIENATKLPYSYRTDAHSRVQRSLNSSWLTALNPINYKNVTVQCINARENGKEDSSEEDQDERDVCKVKVIVIGRLSSNCSMNGSLSCRAADIWELLNQQKNSPRFLIQPKHSQALDPVVKYSIFTHENQSWIFCNETDKTGSRAKTGTHTEIDTESIVCPVPRKSFRGPVLIRIEESEKTGLSVALPFYGGGGNTSYTYFSVFVNQTVYDDNEVDLKSPIVNFNEATVIAPICVGSVVLVCLITVAVVCCKRKCKRVPKENKTSKFYVDNVLCEDPKFYDNMSTRTQTTSANGYTRTVGSNDIPMLDFQNNDHIFLFEDTDEYCPYIPFTDGEDEDSVILRRTIVARQLSGDPSKINPALSLNQQANALAYNPKHEIERKKFSIGQLLGSGNFGSVFVGEAEGLYYPGSVTKVAVKTVNDALDRSQLTALLCEVKILANLEHHLNLVNLMGSCTSELHNGELWLLLEFCAHGDLKNFLIRHRGQFQNNLSGLCATGFDSRLFLKWAHSIAKGMEYLTSKRIMHGDLAARNILISGGDGYVAKVSDFGLSKTFYDNVRYKKRFRHYVPWKWMAIEYLKDACFTMKSDVWSYGVVLWEIFSLGQEPYAGKSIEEVITQIKTGYRLPCPDEVVDVAWADDVYRDVMKKCWDADPSTRCSFGEIVNSLEKLMDLEELNEYRECTDKVRSMKELMLDDSARSKRSLLLSPHSAPADIDTEPDQGYTSNCPTSPDSVYVTVQQARSGNEPNHFIQNGGYISVTEAKQQLNPANGSYITISQAQNHTIVT